MRDLTRVAEYWATHLERDDSTLASGEELFFPALLAVAESAQRVLEVGVGRGRMAKILKRSGVRAEFHGTDINAIAASAGVIGRTGDARCLPYPDDSFDLVYSLGVVEHFPETALAIREHARVVRPGGSVLVTTPHLSIYTPMRRMVHFALERRFGSFEEIRGRNLRLGTMRRWFLEAGLEVTRGGLYGVFGLGRIMPLVRWDAKKLSRGSAYLYVLGRKI